MKRWQSCSDIDKTPVTESRALEAENAELKNKVELQESQLTELHCIVAELKKQLRVNQDARIEEEEEDETSCEDNDDYFEDGIDDLVEGGTARKETEQSRLSKILTQNLQAVRKEHNQIKARLEEKDGQLAKAVGLLKRVRIEKEALVRKVHHLQSLVQTQAHSPTTPTNNPTCRYAARRKLPTQSPTKTPTTLTGPTLSSLAGTLNSCIVEKLINLNEAAMLGELSSQSREQIELVLEKEVLKVDKLSNEVDFLLGRLGEAKSVNEELVGVVGRVESWGMGWKVVAEREESTIELYDILVALLESELGLLLANVKAAGIGLSLDSGTPPGHGSIESLLKRAEFNRDTALTAAKRVLGGKQDKKVGPRLLEHQIRSCIISLKTSSAQITSTIPTYDFNMGEREDWLKISGGVKTSSQTNRMDLETAVLMQELLSCREEKADLKMRLVCVERERDFLGGLVLDDNYKDGIYCELNNNNEEMTSPPPTLSLNHIASSYSLIHSSNSSLLDALEKTKTKYRERVKLLEDRIITLSAGGNK